MTYPYPLKDKQEVTIKLTKGTDDNGKPLVIEVKEGVKCTILYESKVKPDKDGNMSQVKGMLFKKGDIFPNVTRLQGYVISGDEEYVINFGAKIKDPTGKVHHIEMELM